VPGSYFGPKGGEDLSRFPGLEEGGDGKREVNNWNGIKDALGQRGRRYGYFIPEEGGRKALILEGSVPDPEGGGGGGTF